MFLTSIQPQILIKNTISREKSKITLTLFPCIHTVFNADDNCPNKMTKMRRRCHSSKTTEKEVTTWPTPHMQWREIHTQFPAYVLHTWDHIGSCPTSIQNILKIMLVAISSLLGMKETTIHLSWGSAHVTDDEIHKVQQSDMRRTNALRGTLHHNARGLLTITREATDEEHHQQQKMPP
jgi:hypothetical protein